MSRSIEKGMFCSCKVFQEQNKTRQTIHQGSLRLRLSSWYYATAHSFSSPGTRATILKGFLSLNWGSCLRDGEGAKSPLRPKGYYKQEGRVAVAMGWAYNTAASLHPQCPCTGGNTQMLRRPGTCSYAIILVVCLFLFLFLMKTCILQWLHKFL